MWTRTRLSAAVTVSAVTAASTIHTYKQGGVERRVDLNHTSNPRLLQQSLLLGSLKTQFGLQVAGCDVSRRYRDAKLTKRYTGAPKIDEQPGYTKAEVSQRDGSGANPTWVTYRDGVYDVTEFQKEHPGGQYIVQAAGGAIDSFWEIWYYHHGSKKVHAYMETLRIGTLIDWEDTFDEEKDNFYNSEPVAQRGEGQLGLIRAPWCSETYPDVLAASYFTKNEAFYVRNHCPVPCLDDEPPLEHIIEFTTTTTSDAVEKTLGDLLEKYETVDVNSILQCAGNRAADNIRENEGSGFVDTPFETIDVGMLGNAMWSGVRITDVLKDIFAGSISDYANWHVEFEGADGYAGSVPIALLGPECIFATSMNGVALPADHGYPVRVLLPGIAGARCVKWMTRVTLRPTESEAPWNVNYYKKGKIGEKKTIYALPLQSIILDPSPDKPADRSRATIRVSGIAFNGNGSRITQVKVSTNNGKDWVPAKVLTEEVPVNNTSKEFGWVRWTCEVENTSGLKEICCCATDETGEIQPEVGDVNGGYVYNGWHRVSLYSPDVTGWATMKHYLGL
eukprot:m.174950 g.174950  ORF g.174950 m.174950 type:complete len:562 (-) comp31790_c0_seq2:337-2022(-)